MANYGMFVMIFNLKTKTGVVIQIKAMRINAKDSPYGHSYYISDAIDILGNKINLEERKHKLKRYIIGYGMGSEYMSKVLDEYLERYDKEKSGNSGASSVDDVDDDFDDFEFIKTDKKPFRFKEWFHSK